MRLDFLSSPTGRAEGAFCARLSSSDCVLSVASPSLALHNYLCWAKSIELASPALFLLARLSSEWDKADVFGVV